MRTFWAALAVMALAVPAQAGHVSACDPTGGLIPGGSANVSLYLSVVARREMNPAQFDRAHPFYGSILSNPSAFDALVARWQAHPARFEYYHPVLWRVLAGGVQFRNQSYLGPCPVSQPTPWQPLVPNIFAHNRRLWTPGPPSGPNPPNPQSNPAPSNPASPGPSPNPDDSSPPADNEPPAVPPPDPDDSPLPTDNTPTDIPPPEVEPSDPPVNPPPGDSPPPHDTPLSAVPEPSGLLLAIAGLLTLAATVRRRRSKD